MIETMAISFFLILVVGMLLLGTFAVVVLIFTTSMSATISKRPVIAIAAILGLVMLLLIGFSIGSLFVVRAVSHSPPTALVTPGMNTYPDLHIQRPDVVMTQVSTHSGESRSMNFRFSALALFPLLLIAAVIGLIVAVISRSTSPKEHRGRWWPALVVLAPMAALACFALMFGVKVSHRVSVPFVEPMVQDWGPVLDAEKAARGEIALAERHTQLVKAKMAAANAEQTRAESMRRAAEFSAKLQRQFATMDINDLIEMFQAPKIELAEKAEQPAPTDLVSPSPPATAEAPAPPAAPENPAPAPPSDDVASPAAVAEVAADSKSSSVAVEAEPGDAPPAAAKANAEEGQSPPDWIKDQPGMVGQDWHEVIATDEYATAEECRQAMDVYLMLKTAERVQTLVGYPYVDHSRPSLTFDQDSIMGNGQLLMVRGVPFTNDNRLHLLRKMGIGIDEIRRSIVYKEYLAARHSPRAFDTMYSKYTLARFTPWFDEQLRRHWSAYLRQERFAMVGVGAGSVLALLGTVFALLKIDTWTKGYYTKRLFIGVPAAIIGVIFILVVWSEVHF